MALEEKLKKYETHLKVFQAVIIIGTLIGLGGAAYAWYRNNLWKPKVTFIDADFDKVIAHVSIGGVTKTIYGNDVLSAGGNWGVRFGTTGIGQSVYDTVETVNNGNVVDILKIKS